MKAIEHDARFTKVQELIYELTVADVMTREPIAVTPETPMSELRRILRDRRISGTPVVDGARMTGLISVEDFIEWLAQGGEDCAVQDRMSTEVVSIFADEPLVHAIGRLEDHGFGRLPVLDHASGRLVGLITKGDIIEGLLKELQIDYHEEEIHRHRASHFFEDMLAERVIVQFCYHIRATSVEKGGEVASDLKQSLKRLGIHPEAVRRAAIATYEAEMNVIIYAGEGRVRVQVEPRVIRIKIRDRGQGIADIQRALEPGFSTAPDWVRELGFGAGMGLPNIQRCADRLDISSRLGQGTTLTLTIATEPQCA